MNPMIMKVYYEDTDLNRMVYHANYFKYCERARSELFFAKGMKPIVGDEGFFVVRDIQAQFKSSLRLGDVFEVQTSNKAFRRSSIILQQDIFHKDQCAFSMLITLVYMNSNTITKIPDSFKDILKTGL